MLLGPRRSLGKNMKKNIYDEVPYTKYVHQQTQPDNLATIATLFGLQPPPVERCRVLELGCASGINTIAMALAIPQGEFVGIDYSEKQIQEGQQNIQQLGLTNIILKYLNIMEINSDEGLFDYIIAHGVYSWVPWEVRDKILQICRHHLHPQGVAYVSYNVYPGWHINQMLRAMLLYHTRDIDQIQGKLQKSKILLKFFIDALQDRFDVYSLSLKKELNLISRLDENYLTHEYLEEHNEPLFFHEFIEHIQQHGLQYLADSKLTFLAVGDFFPKAAQLELNLIEKEQAMDFLRNHPFRESLLCHQEVTINRNLVPDNINKFYIAAPLKPASPHLVVAPGPLIESLERFNNAAGEAVLSIASPLLKVVCFCLGEVWPHSLSFEQLLRRVGNLLIQLGDNTYQKLMSPENILEVKTLLLEFYLKNLVEFYVHPPKFTLTLNERPVASPLARLQSQQSENVTNLRYEIFPLNLATRQILSHLDGHHDREALVEVLKENIRQGRLQLKREEPAEISEKEIHHYLVQQVEEILKSLLTKVYLLD